MKLTFACLFFTACAAGAFTLDAAQNKAANDSSAVIGDWHGTSFCLVKPSACHDEEALYHVRSAPGNGGKLVMQADKIVDGKPEAMGNADCSFDPAERLLHCDLGRSYVELTLAGDRLEGAMFRADKTRWREIKLTRVKL
jgi:hypothetical protein